MTPSVNMQSSEPIDPLPDDYVPRVSGDLLVDRDGANVILLHPTQARWALTNSIGLHLARQFNGIHTLRRLAEQVAAQYPNLTLREALEDIQRFTLQLLQCGLLAPDIHQSSEPVDRIRTEPPRLTFYPTLECNLRCRHCAVVEGKMPQRLLSRERIFQLIDDHVSRFDNPRIAFLGGEPLLCPDILDLLRFACQRTRHVRLGTNGLLIDASLAEALAALPISIQISLDGADPKTHDWLRGEGTFQKTWEAAERLVRAGAGERTVFAAVLTRSLLPQVRDLISAAQQLGVGGIRFMVLARTRAAAAHWDEISPRPDELKKILRYLLFEYNDSQEPEKFPVRTLFPGFTPNAPPDGSPWCPLGQSFVIHSRGDVFTCPMLGEPEFAAGNALERDLAVIGAGEKNQELRRQMLERRNRLEDCRRCPWRNFCQGGCQAYSYHLTGSLWVNDEYCEFRRELYREYVRRRAAQAG